jgi:hypothetical protein
LLNFSPRKRNFLQTLNPNKNTQTLNPQPSTLNPKL